MENRAQRLLRLDRRLLDRRGWISREELERELAALPDVSDKIQPEESAEVDSPGDFASSENPGSPFPGGERPPEA